MSSRRAKTRVDLIYKRDPDDRGRFFVKDPLRHKYFHFNELQVAMMQALDGSRTTEDLIERLGVEFGEEISPAKVNRFVGRLKSNLLLDVSFYEGNSKKTRKLVAKRLRRAGLEEHCRLPAASAHEAWLFSAALSHAYRGDPCKAAGYFEALLETSPRCKQARQALACIHQAFFATAQSRMHHPMIHLWNPDSFLGRIDRRIGRLVYTPLGLFLIVAFILSAIAPIVEVFSQSDAVGDLTAADFLSFELTILLAIFVHELGHGLSVKHYGGSVDDIGVMLFFGVLPAAYCDTSDTYLFKKKRHKIVVYFSGVIPQMALQAALWYLIAFTNSSLPGYNGILLALIVNFWWNFLNLNPLIPLDAYFALGDALGITNLRPRAFNYVRAVLYRKIFGIRFRLPTTTARERRIFLVYGVSAMIYTTAYIYFLWISVLLPLAVAQLGAFGLLLAGLYFVNLFGRVLFLRFCRMIKLVVQLRGQVFTPRRSAVFAVTAAAVGYLLATPVPHYVDSIMEVEPSARSIVRIDTAGLVSEVRVREGQWIERGEILAVLRSPELERARELAAEGAIEAEIRLRILANGPRSEELDEASARLRSFQVATEGQQRRLSEAEALRDLGVTSQGQFNQVSAAFSDASAAERVSEHDVRIVRAGARGEEVRVATAEVREMAEQLARIESQLERLVIRSPIDGVIVGRAEERRGEFLATGEVLWEVHDLRRVRARIVSEHGNLGVAKGQSVELVAEGASSLKVTAKIDLVSSPVGGGLVMTSTDVPNRRWRSGMRGRARIYGPNRSVAYQVFAEPLIEIVSFDLWRLVWG